MTTNRRYFLKQFTLFGASLSADLTTSYESMAGNIHGKKAAFKISLAEWSFHRAIFGGKMDHLNFAKVAKRDYGIDAIEYVNSMFFERAKDTNYLSQMKQRAADDGVRSRLIMIDREGALGAPDANERTKAVENHYKWVEAAKYLGCKIIRVSARSEGSFDEQMALAADGLSRLTEFAATHNIDVIVENHGGLSSNGKWLVGVMKRVNKSRCGTLPDFGNFNLGNGEEYDRYQGVSEMMPFAKAVSAKSHDFDEKGDEAQIDYYKMMKIVTNAGYHDYVGIEYEGEKLSEPDGVMATLKLLQKILSII
ncbi:MAG: sugar phosphate isomerase/epimerase family protein [Pyrinomonadaceae bacterium]